MKLILHIGTHKTGTTALQQFLYANREPLAVKGFHYATTGHGLTEANFVANALNVGRGRVVQAFFEKHVSVASRNGVHAILASAENFYAMSVLNGMARREACVDPVIRDRTLIATLKSLMPDELQAVQLVCYFRRPDRYAESLYSQHVKRGIGFDGTFGDFLPIIKQALFYAKHVQAWCEVFGEGNITVRPYEPVSADIVGDFVQNVLTIDDIVGFAKRESHANERVSRDVLEFKRLRNREVKFNERDMERTILRLVDEALESREREPVHYQDFLSPDERAELLELLNPEMDALQVSHGVAPFPRFDAESASTSWSPYPGLAPQRRQEIQSQYDLINRRGAFRFERFMLRSAAFTRRHVPSTGVLLDALKKLGAKHALRRAMRRLQLGNG
jgi:hypothetical protein